MTYTITDHNISLFTDFSQKTEFLSHPSVNSKGKRLVDILGAIAGLTITSTIFIPIAIAIILDNPGSILFSQTRCGYQGKTFQIWK
jgi:lipopolysaccharide/colanic/teichoic acid biosynthesis glycosyltransferase